MKFVDFSTNNSGTNQQNNVSEEESFVDKMDISSDGNCDSDSSQHEDKKHHYWPKYIPHDITDALEDAYRLFVSRARTINNINLTVYSIRNRKNIVLLTNCSITTLGSEVK
ncbi:37232_t:CDS:2 [Gigaspora margarita]|uniref:37232_t:CDS:1 n=1 Tax=Gigaspora margarita TaxID=4874 RepID=A0ABN7VPW1_GIGMA|nr:37232_t:CDS:2 [Gigaspora margarita]